MQDSFKVLLVSYLLTSYKSEKVMTKPSIKRWRHRPHPLIKGDAKNLWPYFAMYHKETVNKQLNSKKKVYQFMVSAMDRKRGRVGEKH